MWRGVFIVSNLLGHRVPTERPLHSEEPFPFPIRNPNILLNHDSKSIISERTREYVRIKFIRIYVQDRIFNKVSFVNKICFVNKIYSFRYEVHMKV